MKIAFSTPIFASTAQTGDEPPIGVLSMSIKLEDLEWFTAKVENSTVALVELFREDWPQDELTGGSEDWPNHRPRSSVCCDG